MEGMGMGGGAGEVQEVPPACWHCIGGHVGPGIYILWLSCLMFLEALCTRRLGETRSQLPMWLRVWGGMISGPALALGEALTHRAWHEANVQHFTIYVIVFLDACVTHQIRIRQKVPEGLIAVWEAGVLMCIGFIMGSHFHGGPLVTAMHSLMFPLLGLVSLLVVLDRLLLPHVPMDSPTRTALRLGASILLLASGLWFGSMGPGFWAYGTYGVFGSAFDNSPQLVMEASMKIATMATWDFLFSFLVISTVWMGLGEAVTGPMKTGYNSIWGRWDDVNEVLPLKASV